MKISIYLLAAAWMLQSLNAAQKPNFIFLLSDDQDWASHKELNRMNPYSAWTSTPLSFKPQG